MGLTAEFRLSSPALPLVDVAAAVPDAELTFLHWAGDGAGLTHVVLRATGGDGDDVARAVERASSVERASLIDDSGTTRIYSVVPADSIGGDFDELRPDDGVPESVTVTPEGWRVRGRFPDRSALVALREVCVEHDISFRLERLYESRAASDEVVGLTPRQREALLVASEMGYFDVPRRTSIADVAARLGISAPALSERLRRGQRHLVDHFVSTAGLPRR